MPEKRVLREILAAVLWAELNQAGCYKVLAASTIGMMAVGAKSLGSPEQSELYARAVTEFGRMLDRLPAGYEADADKRCDLRQEIHLQLWKSFRAFDGRCSLKTWCMRVAHNTAASYVVRERRTNATLVSFEEIEQTLESSEQSSNIDRDRALAEVKQVILRLRPLDRQIIISYLEGMDAATVADITGLTPGNIAMKIHRIKKILAHRIREEHSNA